MLLYLDLWTFRVAGVVAHNGLLFVIGGDDGSSNLGSVEYYSPKSDTWTMLTNCMTTGRSYAGVCVIDKPMWLTDLPTITRPVRPPRSGASRPQGDSSDEELQWADNVDNYNDHEEDEA